MRAFLVGISTMIITALALSGCVTVAKYTIKDNLVDMGFSPGKASCMADQLEERLSDEDIQDLARYTAGLSRADSPGQALDALMKVDNARAAGAITASGISCLFAPTG